jgi:hypothetical protein
MQPALRIGRYHAQNARMHDLGASRIGTKPLRPAERTRMQLRAMSAGGFREVSPKLAAEAHRSFSLRSCG